jgi:anaerobic selenocysteine-containing dehydrogenase
MVDTLCGLSPRQFLKMNAAAVAAAVAAAGLLMALPPLTIIVSQSQPLSKSAKAAASRSMTIMTSVACYASWLLRQ